MKAINYYHESMGYIQRSMDEVLDDLSLIKSKFDAIHLYHNPYIPDNMPQIVFTAKKAKEAGLYVVWVENNDTTQLTEAEWGNYSSLVKQDVVWARKAGADEFLVGNEISIHNDSSSGFDDTNLPIKVKTLVNDCKQYFDGVVSYQEGWWKKDSWYNDQLENVEKIYFTLYENFSDFNSNLDDIWQKFGSRASIGEWSTQSTLDSSATDEADWANKIEQRLNVLKGLGIDHSYFCFRDTGENNNQKGFGLIRSDREFPHLAWNVF